MPLPTPRFPMASTSSLAFALTAGATLPDQGSAVGFAPVPCRPPRWPEARVSARCLGLLSWCPPPTAPAPIIHLLTAGWAYFCPCEYDVRARKKFSCGELPSHEVSCAPAPCRCADYAILCRHIPCGF